MPLSVARGLAAVPVIMAADSFPEWLNMRIVRWAPYALAFLPWAYLVYFVARYHVSVPYLDQWELAPLLDKSYEGALQFGDLWEQHNEHRLVFPKLVMLGLARLTRWNIAWEFAASIVFATVTWCLLLYQLCITARGSELTGRVWLAPLVSLLVFSLSQHENWLWGWQLQIFLNVLAVVCGFVLLAHPDGTWWRFFVGLACGVVATFSFANGLCFWVAGLAAMVPIAARRHILGRRLIIWVVLAATVAGLYFHGYQKPDYHPPMGMALLYPFVYIAYVLKYLGMPVLNLGPRLPLIAGAVGLLGFIMGLWRLLRKHAEDVSALAPYTALGLYALASAAITGVARVGFGSGQATSSRYTTVASLLWFANIAFLWWAASRPGRQSTGGSKPEKPVVWPLAALCLTGILILSSSLCGGWTWLADRPRLLVGQEALLHSDDNAGLGLLYPDPDAVRIRRVILHKRGLSVFRNLPNPVGAFHSRGVGFVPRSFVDKAHLEDTLIPAQGRLALTSRLMLCYVPRHFSGLFFVPTLLQSAPGMHQ